MVSNNRSVRKHIVSLTDIGRMMRLDGLALCDVPRHPKIVMGWLMQDLAALAVLSEQDDKPWLGDDLDHVAWLNELGYSNEGGVWI